MNKPYMKIWRQVHYDKKDKPYYKGYYKSAQFFLISFGFVVI